MEAECSQSSSDFKEQASMKLFIATLGTETNTFSPIPTAMPAFEEMMLFRGDATQHPPMLFSEALHVWAQSAADHDMSVVESISAFAQPGGICVRQTYEELRDAILADLKAALPVNMVLLSLHGAMVADGYDDCEGDLLTRVRAIVGPDAAVGGELDLHCSITPAMLSAADALITFKEYPHIDAAARASELFEICQARLEGRVKPVMATWDTRIVASWKTPFEPMKSFVARMSELEGQDDILSVSFAHGFPWGDVPDVTARTLVVADGDAEKAAKLAETLGREIWEMRTETQTPMTTIDDAVAEAMAAPRGPVILADASDNAGGGAPSDSTFILRCILAKGARNVASGPYWDPVAVALAMDAGEGARLRLRIGGKLGPESGDPVDLEVTVRKVRPNATQTFGSVQDRMGDAVWVSTDEGVDLVLNAKRTQAFNPDAFTQFGINLAAKQMIVVKSSQHFYAGFAPIGSEVIFCDGPGALNRDMGKIPYRKFTGPYWPRVANPWR
jgi:microcystin degradation protein MlrC